MRRKKWTGLFLAVCLIGLTGCQNQADTPKETNGQQTRQTVENPKEQAENASQAPSEDAENRVGTGFIPPKGSKLDKNGNIVDPEGNTFNKKGEWQVPEGGSVDSKGYIRDKDGKLVGGGVQVGSVG